MIAKTSIPLILLLGVTGCAGPGRIIGSLTGAAGGAALGHHLSDGNAAWTVAGAAGGVLLAEGAMALSSRAEQKAYQRGLDKGHSDAVKEAYWKQQNAHRPAPESSRATLYPIQFPEQEVDGVVYQPTTRFLRIHR